MTERHHPRTVQTLYPEQLVCEHCLEEPDFQPRSVGELSDDDIVYRIPQSRTGKKSKAHLNKYCRICPYKPVPKKARLLFDATEICSFCRNDVENYVNPGIDVCECC